MAAAKLVTGETVELARHGWAMAERVVRELERRGLEAGWENE